MYVASTTQSELRLVLEAAMALHNALQDDIDARGILRSHGFSRAANASETSVRRLVSRLHGVAPLLHALPDLAVDDAAARVNEELTELPIAPSIAAHDGVGPHLHWTPPTATFDDQVMSDILMALAYELCDNGTNRFGRCGATDCDRLFYDSTRNRSRRFCDDPRCASRTHTADHRARKRGA